MLRYILLFALATASVVSSAQEKLKELSLKDAITRAYSDFRPEHVDALQWIPGTEQYSYVKDNTLMRGGAGKMADLPIVGVEQLNAHFGKETALKSIPDVTWETADVFSFEHNDRVHVYTVSKSAMAERMALEPKAERSDMEATRHQVAFTLGEDLYMRSPSTKENTRITTDGADGIVSGRSVHREEYGITKGTFWSPTGEKLAFYRMDESKVTPYSLEDISTQPSTFKKIRYPMAGQTSHQVKLGVFDVASNRTTFLKTGGDADDYLTNISWEPTGKYVFIIHLNRATDRSRVVQYDASTGEAVKTVLEEEDKKWLEPLHPLTFLKRAPTTFIHWSQQDGFMHLYLYDTNKGLIRQLTKGAWVVKNILGLDEKESAVFIEGTDMIDPKTPSGAMDTHIYRVELGSGKTLRLTKEPGTHSGQLGPGGRFIIDTWSSLSVPGRTEILDATKGTVLKTLVNSKDPLAQMKVGSTEFVRVLGENGDMLNGRMIKPRNFDSRQKYPVLVYVYNGPHVQLVTNSFLGGASLWMLHAAERGYIVFTLDGHGSENRGRAFEQAVYRQLGVTEAKDQLRGVDFLKGLPYVDAERMAVHGWSFGGHVTTALMLRSPGTFKVGVAGGPVMDWGLYEVMYTERYMDTPKENPEGYALTKHTDKVDGLRGKLLVITGGMDDTVLPEHSYTFLKNAVEKNVQLDFFEYPGHGHNVRGKDRVHLYTKVLDYIDQAVGKAL